MGDLHNRGKDMAGFPTKVSSFVDDVVDAKRDDTIKKVNVACESLIDEKNLYSEHLHHKIHNHKVGVNVDEAFTAEEMLDVVYVPTSRMRKGDKRTKKKKITSNRNVERGRSQNNEESQIGDGNSCQTLGSLPYRAVVPVVHTRSKDLCLDEECQLCPDKQQQSFDNGNDDDSFPSLPFRAVVPYRKSRNNSPEKFPRETKKKDSQTTRDEWGRLLDDDEYSSFQFTTSPPYRDIPSTRSKQPTHNLSTTKERPPHLDPRQDSIDGDDCSITIGSLPYRAALPASSNKKTSTSLLNVPPNNNVDDIEKHNKPISNLIIPPKHLRKMDRKQRNSRDRIITPGKILQKKSSKRSDKYLVDEHGFIVDSTFAVLEDLEKGSTIHQFQPTSWESFGEKQHI